MSRKIIYPAAPPVTVLLDPADDAAVIRSALAAHHPSGGRIAVHPTPTASGTTLVLDILAGAVAQRGGVRVLPLLVG